MSRLIGEHYEGDVRVSYVDDGDGIAVRYSQDIDNTLDKIAAVNAEGVQDNEGIGRLKYEFPITLLMEHATERGISWEKLAYSTDHDEEWPRMAAKWSKLTVQQRRKYL